MHVCRIPARVCQCYDVQPFSLVDGPGPKEHGYLCQSLSVCLRPQKFINIHCPSFWNVQDPAFLICIGVCSQWETFTRRPARSHRSKAAIASAARRSYTSSEHPKRDSAISTSSSTGMIGSFPSSCWKQRPTSPTNVFTQSTLTLRNWRRNSRIEKRLGCPHDFVHFELEKFKESSSAIAIFVEGVLLIE